MAGWTRPLGVTLVAAGLGVTAVVSRLVTAAPSRVLVLVDGVVAQDAAVRAAFFPPRAPFAGDGLVAEVRLSPFAVWEPLSVSDIATAVEPFDSVVVVTDGRLPVDPVVARATGASLAERGVTASVAMVARAVKATPGRPVRPIRVLFAEGCARWEFNFLVSALLRDPDVLLHTWIVESDEETPQRRTQRPSWPVLDVSRGLPSGDALDAYDVIVLGDVDAASLVPRGAPARDVPKELRNWVERGGGLFLIAGTRFMPSGWGTGDFAELLPVEVGEAARLGLVPASDGAFNLRLTPEGAASPIFDVADDPDRSRAMWESDSHWAQYWAFPATRASAGAVVLATGRDTPVAVSRTAGRGRVFYLGIDELWRLRWNVADRYFGRFYRRAIDWLTETRVERGAPVPPPPAPGEAGLHELARASNGVSVGVGETSRIVPGPLAFWSPSRRAEARSRGLAFAAGVALVVVGAILLPRWRVP